MTASVAPPDFFALPPDRRQAYLTEIGQIGDYAYDHTFPIVIARPPYTSDCTSLRNASGFIIRFNGRLYLGTADHVWRSFLQRIAEGEDVIFQAGACRIESGRRGVVRDPDGDVAFIPVSESEAGQSKCSISSVAHGWPPPPPEKGSFVVFSGCPEVLRDRSSDSHVEFGSFSAIMRVTAASDEHIICQFEREVWVSDYRKPPPPGTDLSGMSGGPVFSLAHPLDLPLVGLIHEFSPNLELLHIRTFAAVRLP